jgi:hypothetical protein
MAKWPDVPEVYGWLQLDRRGRWLIRSAPARDAAEGMRFERIANTAVTEFINRNYLADADGRWFFQNGPQRVFVTLHYTPFIYRFIGAGTDIATHTGINMGQLGGAWLDERGALLLEGVAGVGALSDQDFGAALALMRDVHGRAAEEGALLDFIEDGAPGRFFLNLGPFRVPIGRIDSSAVARRFGFVADPRPPAGQPDC